MFKKFISTLKSFQENIEKKSNFKNQLNFYPNVEKAYKLYRELGSDAKYDLFQFIIYNYKEKSFNLNDNDFDFLIKTSNLKFKNKVGKNTLSMALTYNQVEEIPFSDKHFQILVKENNFEIDLYDLFRESVYTPSAEDISKILENMILKKYDSPTQKKQNSKLNLLQYAIHYKKIGQTPLEEKHYNYIFDLFPDHKDFLENISTMNISTKFQQEIIEKKRQYDILKEKNMLQNKMSEPIFKNKEIKKHKI